METFQAQPPSQRRVGTFTLGLCLTAFGILFLIHIFFPPLSYVTIFHFWPVLFIVLGGEILYYCFKEKECIFKYDTGAIFILFLVTIFATGMAGIDTLIANFPQYMHLQ